LKVNGHSTMKKILGLVLSVLMWGAIALPVWAQSMPTALAEMRDTQGNTIGVVSLVEVEDGVQINTQIEGFDMAVTEGQRDEHGFHIHETGNCQADDYSSAGGHFNPTKAGHGLLDPDGPHAGDLPNLWVEADGSADYRLTTDLITLQAGDRSVFDEDSSAFIIHEGTDDYHTDPSGASGSRLACGVIRLTQ